jgi:glycerol uptake facilitator-like aquaporin
MNDVSLARKLTSEGLGTALLLATIVGSGIMADRLADGNSALALFGNTIPTGAILVVLIWIFGPLSGAHFNPIVTLAFLVRGELGAARAGFFVLVQLAGAIAGVYAAHLMFAETVMQVSNKLREGPAMAFSEFVAAFGLILTIFGTLRHRPETTPMAVGLYITAAYWFTASTSFANPAVTIARSLTNTFSGIAPSCVPLFVAAQLAGTGAAIIACSWLFPNRRAGDAVQATV